MAWRSMAVTAEVLFNLSFTTIESTTKKKNISKSLQGRHTQVGSLEQVLVAEGDLGRQLVVGRHLVGCILGLLGFVGGDQVLGDEDLLAARAHEEQVGRRELAAQRGAQGQRRAALAWSWWSNKVVVAVINYNINLYEIMIRSIAHQNTQQTY